MYHWCWVRYSTKCTNSVGPGIVLSVPVVLGQVYTKCTTGVGPGIVLSVGQVYTCSTKCTSGVGPGIVLHVNVPLVLGQV